MKRLLLILLFSALSYGQGVRIGDEAPAMTTGTVLGTNVLSPLSGVSVTICDYPANAVPCSNKATTYTSQALTSACSTATQVVLAGTTSCVATSDSRGNWGAWVRPGTYDYVLTTAGGANYGPYTVTAAAGSHAAFANVLSYGALGDGITDDGPAIQAAMTANPGKTIYFPKMLAASTGGAGATNCDYYSSQTLTLVGNGQRLLGDPVSTWSGGSCIKFAADVQGVYIPPTVYGGSIENMEVQGQRCSGAATTADGILIRGGEPVIRNVVSSCFGRHGVYIDGSVAGGGLPDLWFMENVQANNNRANGFLIDGTDANAGLGMRLDARSNVAVGIEDSSTLGNTYVQTHTISNNQPYKMIGASQFGTCLNCYSESGQPVKSRFASHWAVIAGDHGTQIDTTTADYAQLYNVTQGDGINLGSQTYLEVWNRRDAAQNIYMRAGKTADQNAEINWTDYANTGNGKWAIRRNASDNTLKVWNYTTAAAAVSIDPTTSVTTLTGISTGSAGSANKAVCWKTTTTLGYCSTTPDAGGACTCN